MPIDKVEHIAEKLSSIEGDLERKEIFALLRTRLAGGYEAMGEGKKASDYWTVLNEDLEAIVHTDPKGAFEFAVESLNLDPTVGNTDQYRFWLQGNCLIILSHPNIRPLLIHDLENPKSSRVLSPFKSTLNYQIPPEVHSKEDFSRYPQCFNLVMGLVIVHGLEDERLLSMPDLERQANDLLNNERIKQIIGLFYDVEEDRELVRPLLDIIQGTSE